jgi:hypothetical protein
MSDPSGQCYSPLDWLRQIPGEDTLCNYMDMAAFVWGAPMATGGERALAGTYIFGWALAHSLLLVGAGLFSLGTAIAGGELIASLYGWASAWLAGSLTLGEAATLIGYVAATSEFAVDLAIGTEAYLIYQAVICGNQDAAAALWAGYFLTGESALARGLARAWSSLTADVNLLNTATGELEVAASRAKASVEPVPQPVYGTRVHTAFRQQVEALGRTDLFTEVSYLNGEVVDWGTPGSVRVDVVMGPSRWDPLALFDLKTGAEGLTPSRIQELLAHLPEHVQAIPVIEIRP